MLQGPGRNEAIDPGAEHRQSFDSPTFKYLGRPKPADAHLPGEHPAGSLRMIAQALGSIADSIGITGEGAQQEIPIKNVHDRVRIARLLTDRLDAAC